MPLVWLSAQDKCGLVAEINELRNTDPEKYAKALSAYQQRIFKLKENLQATSSSSSTNSPCPNGITVIPIAFHIFHESGAAIGTQHNFSKDDLVKVVDALNADFSGTNPDKDILTEAFQTVDGGHTCIQFSIGKINRIDISGCPDWTPTADFDELNSCLPGGSGPGSENDPNEYLNFYSTQLQGILGIASCIPPFSQCNDARDGIAVNWDVLTIGVNYIGRTATHEIGHWLGLPHVNGDINGGGCSGDDGFDDTNLQFDQQFYQCGTLVPSSCGSQDNVFNYMDYSDDCALASFTEEQKAAMQTVLSNERLNLTGSYANGNSLDSLYDTDCSLVSLQPDDTLSLTLDCGGDINFLEIIKNWYPAQSGTDYPQNGLSLFYWSDMGLDGDMPGSYYDLGDEEFLHSGGMGNDTLYYTLTYDCWDAKSSTYGGPQLAGTVEVIILAQNCSGCIPGITAPYPDQQLENGCENKGSTVEWSFSWTPCLLAEKYQLKVRNGDGFLALDDSTVIDTFYNFSQDTFFLQDSAWMVAVRAKINGLWKEWSDTVQFQLDTVNTNCNAPENDDCADAIMLPVNPGFCIGSVFTLEDATASGEGVPFTCGDTNVMDVWFVAQVPVSGDLTIQTDYTGSIFDIVMQVYSGDCMNLILIDCDDDSGVFNQSKIRLHNRVAGELIYIQIVAYADAEQGTFSICAFEPLPQVCQDEENFDFYAHGDTFPNIKPQEWMIYPGGHSNQGALVDSNYNKCGDKNGLVLSSAIVDPTDIIHMPDIGNEEIIEYHVNIFAGWNSNYIAILHDIVHPGTGEVNPAIELNFFQNQIFISSQEGIFLVGYYDSDTIDISLYIDRYNDLLSVVINDRIVDQHPFSTSLKGLPNDHFAGLNYYGGIGSYHVDCICWNAYDISNCPDSLFVEYAQDTIPSENYGAKEIVYSEDLIASDSIVHFCAGEEIELLPNFSVDTNAIFTAEIVLSPCLNLNKNKTNPAIEFQIEPQSIFEGRQTIKDRQNWPALAPVQTTRKR